jgi:hypothetical protein
MEKLAENDLTYFYLRHVVMVVTAVTTMSLTPVISVMDLECNLITVKLMQYEFIVDLLWSHRAAPCDTI